MITVVVLVKNEAAQLTELLPTLEWADSLLVIDDDSTDLTEKICSTYSTQHVRHSLAADFASQRNFALSQIKEGWVLFIDADERLDNQLIRSIKEAIQQGVDHKTGYQLLRQDVFLGKVLRHGEAGGIWLTRLAYRSAGEWRGAVHEVWDIHDTKRLSGTMKHYSHDSVGQLFRAVQRYAPIRADELTRQGESWSLWQQITYPAGKFLVNYFFRLGFLDGWQGFLMAIAMSWHSWLVRARMWQKISGIGKYIAIMPWLLLPFGQLTRVEFGGGAWYGFELFMGLTLLWRLFAGKISQVIWPKWWVGMIGLTAMMGLSLVLSVIFGKPWVGGLYWMRWLLYVGYLAVLWEGMRSWFKISMAGVIRFVGTGLLVGGWLQYLLMPDMRWLQLFGWDDHYFRMIGLLFDPNYLGALLLLFGVWVLFRDLGKAKWILLMMTLGALVATYSRTSLALLGLVIGVVLIHKRQWKIGMVGLLLGAGIWMVLPKPGGEGVNLLRQFSITTRLTSWQQAGTLFLSHPIMGIGFNQYVSAVPAVGQFGVDYHPSAPDNSWLFVLATTGIIGMGCFVWLISGWLLTNKSRMFRLSLVVILLHSMTNNTFFYPWVLLWLWLLLLEEHQLVS